MAISYFDFTKKLTLWLIIIASLSTTLRTAVLSISLGLLVLAWLSSANYLSKFERIKQNPAAVAALALFVLYGIGTLYSSADWDMRLEFLGKYHKLLYIPLIVSVLDTDKYRRYALNAFLLGMVIVLTISYLKWMGLVPHHQYVEDGYVVFTRRIAHSVLMSFAMYMFMLRASTSIGRIKLVWIALSILACLNVLFLVNGRTGQLIMMTLVVWFTYEKWGRKVVAYWLGLALLGIALNQIIPILPQSRLFEIGQEIAEQKKTGTLTSSGQRLEMYTNSIPLIKQHPFFGGGTGSFYNEYAALAINNNSLLTEVPNPHNQFLLTTHELGFVGLFVLIVMWSLQWRTSFQLSLQPTNFSKGDEYGPLLRGLILTIVIDSLFNSPLLDAGEGKFYCVLAGILLSAYQTKKVHYEK